MKVLQTLILLLLQNNCMKSEARKTYLVKEQLQQDSVKAT
jgi:hypothetical protein